jgi:hypothetical protein
MADTVVIAEETQDEAHHFSWGLAIAGGITAAAMLFFLLTLGSGFGLMLFRPAPGATLSAPTFLTGGAIYFLVAQLFSFAFGGHLVGRLLAPAFETREHEEFRAAAHGFVSWAVAVFGTLAIAVIATLSAMDSISHLYAPTMAKSQPAGPTAYVVDKLLRPAAPAAAPAKDAAPSMTPVKKNAKGVKKSSKKVVDTAAKPATAEKPAVTATPAGK